MQLGGNDSLARWGGRAWLILIALACFGIGTPAFLRSCSFLSRAAVVEGTVTGRGRHQVFHGRRQRRIYFVEYPGQDGRTLSGTVRTNKIYDEGDSIRVAYLPESRSSSLRDASFSQNLALPVLLLLGGIACLIGLTWPFWKKLHESIVFRDELKERHDRRRQERREAPRRPASHGTRDVSISEIVSDDAPPITHVVVCDEAGRSHTYRSLEEMPQAVRAEVESLQSAGSTPRPTRDTAGGLYPLTWDEVQVQSRRHTSGGAQTDELNVTRKMSFEEFATLKREASTFDGGESVPAETVPAPAEPGGEPIYDIQDAVAVVWRELTPEMKSGLSRRDVELVLELQSQYLERAGLVSDHPEPDESPGEIDQADVARFIQKEAAGRGRRLTRESVEAVLEAEEVYLRQIGVI